MRARTPRNSPSYGESVESQFDGVSLKIRTLEKKYHPGDGNLHFEGIAKPDRLLFENLVALARQTLDLVHKNRNYFMQHALYDAGNCYGLFVLIRASAGGVNKAKRQNLIPPETVDELIGILIEFSEYTEARPGDILSRNAEALGDLLIAFKDKRYFDLARNIAAESKWNKRDSVDWAIAKAEEILRK